MDLNMMSLLGKFRSTLIVLWICIGAILTPAHSRDAAGRNLNALTNLTDGHIIPFDGVPDRNNTHTFFRGLIQIGQDVFIPKARVYRDDPVTFYTNYIYAIAKATWALNEREFSGIMTGILMANSSNSRQMSILAETVQNIYSVISNIKASNDRKRLTTYQEFRQKIEDIIGRETGRRPAATERYKAAAAIPTNRNRAIQKTENGNEFGLNITFGDVEPHPFVSKAVAFVSTYNLTRPSFNMGIAIRLSTKDGRDRYIVIQNPYFDTEDQNSPYTIRAHAIFHKTTPGGDPGLTSHMNIELDKTLNQDENAERKRVGLTEIGNGNIQSHIGTLSPNNIYLTELPERALHRNEIYSFVSKITGRDGHNSHVKADTLHILAGNTIREKIYEIAQRSRTVGDFVDNLKRATLSTPLTGFTPHLEKMEHFIAE